MKVVLKHLLLIVIVLAVMFPVIYTLMPKTDIITEEKIEMQPRVYVTNTGDCYHALGCHYLLSKNAIGLQEAIKKGYDECSYCHGEADGQIEVKHYEHITVDVTSEAIFDSLFASLGIAAVTYIILFLCLRDTAYFKPWKKDE